MGNLLKILGFKRYFNLREHGSVTKKEIQICEDMHLPSGWLQSVKG